MRYLYDRMCGQEKKKRGGANGNGHVLVTLPKIVKKWKSISQYSMCYIESFVGLLLSDLQFPAEFKSI